MKLIYFIRQNTIILINTIVCFFILDLALTKIYGLKGYAEFFESNNRVGYINKRGFSGVFGGPLDEFNNVVNIDRFGNRYSANKICKNKNLNENKYQKVLFVGDSALAGFEVDDNETYVSILNKKCDNNFRFINGGVRGHDTHMAIANLKRLIIEKDLDHKDTKFIYMLTSNDFRENDYKNSYFGMKSKFGSIYDSTFYKPYSNPLKMKTKEFLGKNFYFLKKFRRFLILKYAEYKNNKENKKILNINKSIDQEKNIAKKCKRVIDIISSSILGERSIKEIYIISHPGLSKNSLDNFKIQENCLNNASKTNENIIVIQIANELEDILENRKSNLSFKFKRDSHYNKNGHYILSQVINNIITSKSFEDYIN